MTPLITRIAPSPTGLFHLGTARTGYSNWLAARASGGKFILRIDDTDKERNTQENVDLIFRSMEWLGLDWDEVHYQSQRTGRYLEVANQMIDRGYAEADDDGVIRLHLHSSAFKGAAWRDTIAGVMETNDKDYELAHGMPIVRANGDPLYNFCCVVDDLDMGVNFILRGTDHISNTPKQLFVHMCMDMLEDTLRDIEYAHVGLITIGNTKMSKRNPDHAELASIQAYKDKGYHPRAMLNFLLRMGWGPKQDDKTTAMLDMDRALELFLEGGNLKSNPAKLDLAKLEAYDRKYKNKDRQAEKALVAEYTPMLLA